MRPLTLAVGLLLGATSCGLADDSLQSPLSPKDSLDYLRLHPGLSLELAASEPQIVDPVAIRFDEDSRMWVVEMRDYPHGPATGEQPKSRIKILTDNNRDGFFETATIFADRLLFVTGIQPWQGGVIVTMAGKVAYMKDTDGDNRADVNETWYTGFAQENSQLRANHPTLGLDNHVYIANGLRGGTVVDARLAGSKPLSISGMDFRFDPRTGQFEALSGVGQFGLTFDQFGNRFVCSNRNPLKHIVIEDRYLKRNPAAAVAQTFHDTATAGADSRIFPISEFWTTSNLHEGQFTAACGVLINRGYGLKDTFHGNAFTCDPTGNLVHREIVRTEGATFTSKPGRNGIEFLASPDTWFRPVNLELGPNDELYVVDMYRAVIEHPQFMPEELKRRPDLHLGTDRGRIYRISGSPKSTAHDWPKYRDKSSADLVTLLDNQPLKSWTQETAARLLLERRDLKIVENLEQMVRNGRVPTARIRALWLLQAYGKLSDTLLFEALGDDHPRLVEHAVVAAETRMENNALLREAIRKIAPSDDDRLNFQIALSFAPAADDKDKSTLIDIALHSSNHPWLQRAVTIAIGKYVGELAARYAEQTIRLDRVPSSQDAEFLRGLIPMLVNQPDDVQREFLDTLLGHPENKRVRPFRFTGLESLLGQRARRRKSVDAIIDQSTKVRFNQLLDEARRIANDDQEADAARGRAIDLLAVVKPLDSSILSLAFNASSQAVRLRAIRAASGHADLDPWKRMLSAFPAETPTIRAAILDSVIGPADRAALLLDELSAGRIKPAELDRLRVNRLLAHRDATIKKRAAQILADAVPADRQKVLSEYQRVLSMKSNPKHGLEVFRKNCATCHKVGDLGVNVAPDISDSRTKKPAQILADILQPNRAIDANYVSYSAVTDDGRVLTGILSSETANSVTLKQPEGKTVTLLRSEIDELRSNGISLMPEGLEKNVPHQDMADLIGFIKNWRYLDGRTPLGK